MQVWNSWNTRTYQFGLDQSINDSPSPCLLPFLLPSTQGVVYVSPMNAPPIAGLDRELFRAHLLADALALQAVVLNVHRALNPFPFGRGCYSADYWLGHVLAVAGG